MEVCDKKNFKTNDALLFIMDQILQYLNVLKLSLFPVNLLNFQSDQESPYQQSVS